MEKFNAYFIPGLECQQNFAGSVSELQKKKAGMPVPSIFLFK